MRCGISLAAAVAEAQAPLRLGRPDEPTEKHHFWATTTIAWATFVIFAGQVWTSISRGEGIPLLSGGAPLKFGSMPLDPAAVREEPWRLLSCVFVHYGALHFGLNMLGLMNLSRVAEPAVGSARFAIAYVMTGLVGSAATIAMSMVSGFHPAGQTAGASGAIFGIMGLILGVLLRRKNPLWKQFAFQAVLYSVVFGFAVNQSRSGISINNTAHIGGLLSGIVFGLIYGGPRRPTSNRWMNLWAALCLIACLVALGLAQLSPYGREPDRRTRGASLEIVQPPRFERPAIPELLSPNPAPGSSPVIAPGTSTV